MSLDDVATDSSSGPGRAVVRALRARVAARRPAQRPFRVGVEQRVLLLDAEPGLLGDALVHGGGARGAGVGRDGLELT